MVVAIPAGLYAGDKTGHIITDKKGFAEAQNNYFAGWQLALPLH